MTLYNQLINQILSLLPSECKRLDYKPSSLEKADKNNILLLKDTAYELGGSQKPCISTMAVSGTMHFENSVLLIGKDIFEIKDDSAFAKIVLIEIDDIDEDDAFNKIKELELVRYGFCPKGFMTRASALNMREQIRVSKKAVRAQVGFSDFGSMLIDEYLKNPIVKGVEVIFVTQPDIIGELGVIAEKIKDTTSALNHIFDNILFDCKSCTLKAICDEVEGMKELHMKKAAK